MYAQKTRLAMILAIAATAPAGAGAASDKSQAVTDAENDYKRTELAIYDALSTDPSPRIAILAGKIYVPRDDATPTALRPKREQVTARAVESAPDDAFVQWMAASQGSFSSSACGPTTWPEVEVANLVRLEPDNAAAWQFAVALAHAKGDQAGIDSALSHMAASAHADDHTIDTIGAWTTAAQVHSEIVDNVHAYWFDDQVELTLQQKTLIEALSRVMFDSQPAKAALEAVCKPDAKSDRMWQRLGWCADAGKLFAEKGASLALRKQGLDLLAAADVHDDDVAKAQRQYDWLEEHDANPTRATHVSNDSPADVAADWQGALTEIAAIERRLKRLGLPSSPPQGWTKEVSREQQGSADSMQKVTELYGEYLKSLTADMSANGTPEQRVLAAFNDRFLSELEAPQDAPKTAPATPTAPETITALADGNAGNLKVQWLVAASSDNRISIDTKAGAIARIQDAESDNAAAWSLSLPADADAGASNESVDATLKSMASSARYDAHSMYTASTMLDAMRKHPPQQELLSVWNSTLGRDVASDAATKVMAIGIAYASMSRSGASTVCAPPKDGALAPARREACIAIGRLMVHKSTDLLAVGFGDSILRKLDALDAADADRVKHVRWWAESVIGDDTKAAEYLDELFTSNEIEAFRKAAERQGKIEPPTDWTPARGPFVK